jgi:large subunit ribosomal protein L10
MKVVKNTLLRKAMERVEGKDYSELYPSIVGQTAILFAEKGNAPAKLIKDFRKKGDRPALKSAWIDEAVFIGDDQLVMLSELKGREELIGEIIGLLQSPMKNVISALQGSGGHKIAGLVKALEERAA